MSSINTITKESKNHFNTPFIKIINNVGVLVNPNDVTNNS